MMKRAAAEWERTQMIDILEAHGYESADVDRLMAEGMGPEELEHRARMAGDLERTHGLRRAN